MPLDYLFWLKYYQRNQKVVSKSLRAIKFAIQTMAAGQKGKKLSPF
jgi:hypothetical protein